MYVAGACPDYCDRWHNRKLHKLQVLTRSTRYSLHKLRSKTRAKLSPPVAGPIRIYLLPVDESSRVFFQWMWTYTGPEFTLIFMIKVFGWFMFWRIFYFNCTAVLVKYQTRISTAVLNLLLQSTKNIMNESCSVSGYAEHGAEHMQLCMAQGISQCLNKNKFSSEWPG